MTMANQLSGGFEGGRWIPDARTHRNLPRATPAGRPGYPPAHGADRSCLPAGAGRPCPVALPWTGQRQSARAGRYRHRLQVHRAELHRAGFSHPGPPPQAAVTMVRPGRYQPRSTNPKLWDGDASFTGIRQLAGAYRRDNGLSPEAPSRATRAGADQIQVCQSGHA